MRTLSVIALALLVGCGAEAPTQTSDAGASDATGDASDGAACARGFALVDGPRCASYSDTNCDGMACRAGTHCNVDTDAMGRAIVICE